MGDRIYSLALGLDYNLMIRTWEIVSSTPLHYDIQPREVPNTAAMSNTTRIKKDDVCNDFSKARYYWSKRQLFEKEIKNQREAILRYAAGIVRCKEEIGAFKELEKSLPHYER